MQIDVTKRLSQEELKAPASDYINPFEHTFRENQSVEEVLRILHSKKIEKQVDYFYIIGQDDILKGIISVHDLVYNPPKMRLSELAETEVIKVEMDEPLEMALKLIAQHQILIIPVVNLEGRFLGVIEILGNDHEFLQTKKKQKKELHEDLFQFIGFSIEQGKKTSSWFEYRQRMPWLFCNLIGGLICAVIGQLFQLTLIEFVILAFFIPLVLTLSESIGMQSMTLSLRFLHLRKIHWIQIWRRILIEWKTSVLLGVSSAVVIGFFYLAWSVDIKPMIAIGSSTIISMVVSATFGAFFPILLHILHLDPKVAAGPVVLMMADIFTISIYLGFSTAFLR